MLFFGLLDHELSEVIEFYGSRDLADRELGEIIRDEPGWKGRYAIVLVEFSGREVEVFPAS